jgi:hypothetical protein
LVVADELTQYEEVERCARNGCSKGVEQLIRLAFQQSFFRRRARETLMELGIAACDDAAEQEMRA